MWRDLAIMLGAFAAGTAAGEAFGATNLGTSATIGTLAFAAAMMYVLLRRP